MKIDKSQVKRILVITLSNVGDIIITTPVIKTLAREFPDARIDVMVGPRGKEIFEHDPRIFKLIIYDKHIPVAAKRRLQLKLKKMKYDLVADLRNTIFGLLIGPRYRTATVQRFPSTAVHMRDRHLSRLKSLGIERPDKAYYIHVPEEDQACIDGLLRQLGVGDMVVVNPGARSHLKRWTAEAFASVCDRLTSECGIDVVFVGIGEDGKIVSDIIARMRSRPHSLIDRTNVRQLAGLLKRAKLLITNDSAPLHLGCAVGAKVLAIFGPTDPKKYGPTGEFDTVVNKRLSCSPCERPVCAFNYECMRLITPDEVFEAAKMMIRGYE
jgi:ADP-heptose:LPS heptosyltransferase